MLGGAAFFAVNNCLAGTASALAHRAPVLRNLGDDLLFQAATAAVLLGLAPVIVVAADFSLGLAAAHPAAPRRPCTSAGHGR